MKKYFLLIVLIAVSNPNYAQTKNEIAAFYGMSAGSAKYCVLRSGNLDGTGSGSLKLGYSLSLRYITGIENHNKMSIETGVDFLTGKLEITPAFTGGPISGVYVVEELNLTSIPIFINHYFGDLLFLNEGIMLDFQNAGAENYTGIGVGIGFGVGVRHKHNNFTFYLNPVCRKHLFLSEKYGLAEWGVKFGIGYLL